MKRLFAALMVCMSLIPVTACAKSVPNEANARAVFEYQLTRQLRTAPFVLVSFRKTNGVSRDVFGTQVYVVEYLAVVEYPEGVRPECVSRNGSFPGWSCGLAQSQGLRPKARGAQEQLKGEIVFEKTERGWRGADGNLY